MRRVHEEHRPLSGLGLCQPGFHFRFEIGGLNLWVGFSRDHPDFPATQMEFFLRNCHTCVSLRLIPVRSAISLWACLILVGGIEGRSVLHDLLLNQNCTPISSLRRKGRGFDRRILVTGLLDKPELLAYNIC